MGLRDGGLGQAFLAQPSGLAGGTGAPGTLWVADAESSATRPEMMWFSYCL